MELVNNTQFEPTFLDGGLDSPYFSRDSMVTPCITGLFNGEVLHAMADNNIMNCVGDNSVAELQSPNPYHGIITTVETHGYDGIFIVPREDLDIDYDDTLPEEVVDEYNTIYKTSLTFEDIMKIELLYGLEDKTVFRHDPFMMHQANGRMFSYEDPVAGVTHKVSMLTLWTDRVVKTLMSYFNMPIVAPKMSDLVKIWKNRLAMDTCGLEATLLITVDNLLVGIELTSQNDCMVAISGLTLSGSTVTMETVGLETTAWIQMTANVLQELTLVTPLAL